MVNLYDDTNSDDLKNYENIDEQASTTNSNEKTSTHKKRKRRKKSKSNVADTSNIYTYS